MKNRCVKLAETRTYFEENQSGAEMELGDMVEEVRTEEFSVIVAVLMVFWNLRWVIWHEKTRK